MQRDIDIVKRYYDEHAQDEWERLGGISFEFAITLEMIDRFVKPGDRILDLGGGPGRYAIHYAAKGCDVTLVDLAAGNVAVAKREAQLAGVRLDAFVADARDLSHLKIGGFDHVFVMGPLYHLLAEKDRVKAIENAIAMLKPEGRLYVSFLLLFAGMIYYMKNDPEGIITDPQREPYLTDVVAGQPYGGDAFTKAYFIHPDAILPFMARFPLMKETLFGQESILAPQESAFQKASEAARNEWMRVALALADKPEYLSFAEHAMYVGKRVQR